VYGTSTFQRPRSDARARASGGEIDIQCVEELGGAQARVHRAKRPPHHTTINALRCSRAALHSPVRYTVGSARIPDLGIAGGRISDRRERGPAPTTLTSLKCIFEDYFPRRRPPALSIIYVL
jgi:hypothetical protein